MIYGNNCEFYREGKCLKKNAFCDLKCDMDSLEGGFIGLRASLKTEEKSEGDPDLKKPPSYRLHTIARK